MEYSQGIRDEELVRRSREGDRLLLTRDRTLAKRTRRAILLRSLEVEGQLKELRLAIPDLDRGVRFVHCSLCNGPLYEADRSTPRPPKGVPEDRWGGGLTRYTSAGPAARPTGKAATLGKSD